MRAVALSKEEHNSILETIRNKPNFTGRLLAKTIKEEGQERIILYDFFNGKHTGAHEEVRETE